MFRINASSIARLLPGLLGVLLAGSVLASQRELFKYPDREVRSYLDLHLLERQMLPGQTEIAINPEIFDAQTGDELLLSLPGLEPQLVLFDKLVQHKQSGNVTWIGHLKELPAYRVMLTGTGSIYIGTIETPGKSYAIRYENGETHLLDYESAGMELLLPLESDTLKPPLRRLFRRAPSESVLPLIQQSSAGTAVIDLLVLYSTGFAQDNSETGPRVMIDALVSKANQAYADSAIDMSLQVIHTQEIDFADDFPNQSTLVDYLTANQGEFAGVSALRDSVGADLVVFLRKYTYPESGSCGIAWTMLAQHYTNPSWFDGYVYSIIDSGSDGSQYCGDYVLAHELGHQMGSSHDWVIPDAGNGVFPYANGHRVQGLFGTIMSYASNGLPLFSNPELTSQCSGQPCGTSEGLPNEADNAKAFRLTGPMIAAFRTPTDADGDGLVGVNDNCPGISNTDQLDTDSDGEGDACDTDDDGDGVLDSVDAFPLISLGGRTDTDGDGAPDDCEQTCLDAGLTADTDDDGDGVLDANDAFPLISLGSLTDTDGDGAPDACDSVCLGLNMTADTDDDDDAILDTNDNCPVHANANQKDTDADTEGDACDTDDDNDGLLDGDDAYPTTSITGYADADGDGAPDDCDQTCINTGMSADTDDDGDGIADTSDRYPLIALGSRTDTDADGAPDSCDATCLSLGMTADEDDDNDGALDVADNCPLDYNPTMADSDGDGIGDACDTNGNTGPAITQPTDGEVFVVSGISFSWNGVSGVSGYALKLTEQTRGNTLFFGSLLGETSTSTLISLPDGQYRFSVRSCTSSDFNPNNCSMASTTTFSVDLTEPSTVPAITAPVDGANLTSSTQTLSWSSVAKADDNLSLYYELIVDDIADGTTALQISVYDPATSTIATLPSSTQYRMKVRACQAGCGPWLTPVNFSMTLAVVPSTAPTITSAVVTGNSLTADWSSVAGADFYRFHAVQPSGGPGGSALTVAARQVSGTWVTVPVPAGDTNLVVQACTGDGCGPYSGAVLVSPTDANPPTPNLGTPLAGSYVDGPGVEFSWSRIPGDDGSNTTYRLFVQDLSLQSTALDVYTTNNFYAAYFKAEGARYDALVVANPGPSQIVGPASGFNVIGTSSTAPTMMQPAHNSTVTEGNIQLGWTAVPGATLYEYYVAVLGESSASVRGVTPGRVVQVGLSAVGGTDTIYSSIVRACPAGATCVAGSETGWGDWSVNAGPGVTNFTVVP